MIKEVINKLNPQNNKKVLTYTYLKVEGVFIGRFEKSYKKIGWNYHKDVIETARNNGIEIIVRQFPEEVEKGKHTLFSLKFLNKLKLSH